MSVETFTVDEVAAQLKCSAWWVREQIKAGVVAPIRIGPHKRAAYRLTPAHIEQLVTASTPVDTTPTRKRRRRRVA